MDITPSLILATAASVQDTTGRNGRKNARLGHKVFVTSIWRNVPATSVAPARDHDPARNKKFDSGDQL
jgi:hypothetical protein